MTAARVTDAVVIGAGIVGLSTAYYLSKGGARVVVLETRDVASGTTGSSDGNIMVQSKRSGLMLRLAMAGADIYSSLVNELDEDVEYVRHGSLLVIENEDDGRAMTPIIHAQRESGLNVQLLDRADAVELQPGLAEHVIAASFLSDDANINQLAFCFALSRALQRNAAQLRLGTSVIGILAKDGHVRGVQTNYGDVLAPNVVLAAGVWSPLIAQTIGLMLPIIPRKGQILVAERCPPFIRTSLLSPSYIQHKHDSSQHEEMNDDRGTTVSFSLDQTRSGTLLIGSSREFVGFDDRPSPEIFRAIGRSALRVFPTLANVRIIRSFAGLRPFTPDGRPMIGEVESVAGLYVASGHEGDGIALGPITGKLIADTILRGSCDWDLSPFSPSRFVT